MYSNNYSILYLDIRYGDGERVRSSTKLKDTPKNRKLLETNIIPKIEVQILNGEYNPKTKQVVVPDTVKEYGYKSLQRHQNKRREHVQASYIRHFKTKIIPYFGDTLIREISPIQLMDWQNELMTTCKASSVKKYRTIFNGIFEDAYKERINGNRMISSNPFREVDVPMQREVFADGIEESLSDGEINPFSFEELEKLLSRTDGYLKNFIGIMSRTGMRPGELTALRWSDIDFNNEIIKVRRTRILGKNGPPKKKASVRDVEMLSGVKEFFLNQYKLTGNSSIDDVFINNNHTPFYNHDIIAKQFKALLADKDKRYLYQLRHSFATMMISEGEDILWVSKMLGHKNSDITLKTYAKAYSISHNKNERKKRALFLEKGTV